MTAEMWQQADVANAFLETRRHVPCIDLLFDAARRLVRDIGREPACIVDLGCGAGIVGDAMLGEWPNASLIAVDFSPPMLDQARQRFADRPNVTVVEGDLAERGLMSRLIAEPVDVVISSFAIHHLRRSDQRALYAEVFDVLASGGAFVNIEHVASASPRIEEMFWSWFYDRMAASRNAEGESVTADQLRRDGESRQEMNILTDVHQQTEWLREIGFTDVDVAFKAWELAVFGGYRPATS